MLNFRTKLYYLVESPIGENDDNTKFDPYDIIMMITIVISIIPLAFKESNIFFEVIDKVCVAIFILDYLLRWCLADFILKKGKKSFIIYPFSIMAIIDLLAILPSLNIISNGFKLLKMIRLVRTFRVFRMLRLLKAVRYTRGIQLILDVFKKTKESLMIVCGIAIGYVLISALIVFNVEPDTFNNFFDAVYWATVSLTTMGYGDIYPVTVAGRIITMISSFMGIAIIALPASILTSEMMNNINKGEQEK